MGGFAPALLAPLRSTAHGLHPTLSRHVAPPLSQVPRDQLHMVNGAVGHRFAAFQQEYGLKEASLSITTAPTAAAPASCLTLEAGCRLVDLLLTLPHGVVKHSHAVEGEPHNSETQDFPANGWFGALPGPHSFTAMARNGAEVSFGLHMLVRRLVAPTTTCA